MRKSITLLALLTFGAAQAQDTLYYWNAFNQGDRAIYGHRDQTLSPNVNPGTGGLGQTWNFTSTAFEYNDTINVSAMSWVPSQYTNEFPQSTLAMFYGNNITLYDFVHTDTSGFYIDGTATLDSTYGVIVQEYSDPLQFLDWPMYYGTTYADTGYSNRKYPIAGPNDSAWEVMTVEMTVQVDGQGTLITSYGVYDILRVRRDVEYWVQYATHNVNTGWSSFNPVNYTARMYEFWSDSIFVNWLVASLNVNPANDVVQSYMIMKDYTTEIPETHTALPVMLYPNPAKDILMLSGATGAQWEIADMSGRTIISGMLMNKTEEIDISALAAGMYIVHTHTDESSGSARFIVE